MAKNNKKFSRIEKLLNEDYESYYWMGFLMADGHFYPHPRPGLKVQLAIKDMDHVIKFHKYIESAHTISFTKCRSKCGINLYDINIFPDLYKKFDIKTTKTYNPPSTNFYENLEQDKFISFFAGFIDGDGCICIQGDGKNKRIDIGNHITWLDFHKMMHRKIQDITGLKFAQPKKDSAGLAKITIGSNQIQKFLKREVIRLNLPVLERKWSKIDVDRDIIDERVAKIIPLFREGKTEEEICEILGFQSYLVRLHIRESEGIYKQKNHLSALNIEERRKIEYILINNLETPSKLAKKYNIPENSFYYIKRILSGGKP